MDELTFAYMQQRQQVNITLFPYKAIILISEDQFLHVTLWKDWEQTNGEWNNSVLYMDRYPLSPDGLEKAISELTKYTGELSHASLA